MPLSKFFQDLGFYASTLSLLCALITVWANPRRSVNLIHAGLCALLSCWQFLVMMIRVTGDIKSGGLFILPIGSSLFPTVFLLHDSVIYPQASFLSRLRREKAVLSVVALSVLAATYLTMWQTTYHATFGAFSWPPRIWALFLIGWAFKRCISNSTKCPEANRYEVLLFNYTTAIFFAIFLVFTLVRTPIGNRINSCLVIGFALLTLFYMWHDRVLDSKGTAKRVMSWVVIALIHVALLSGALKLASVALGDAGPFPIWGISVASLAINAVLFVFVHPQIAKRINAEISQSKEVTRRSLAGLTSKASKELEVLTITEKVSSHFVGGLPVTVRVFGSASDTSFGSSGYEDSAGAIYGQLHTLASSGNLTPFSALRVLRGHGLTQALDLMKKGKLGAVVRRSSDGISLTLFVGERGGGSRSISIYEMEHLEELASTALANIVRIRAVNSSVRAQSHAAIGQIVSQFNHESRNQLDSIKLFLAALENPNDRAKITSPHLRMIQDTCDELSSGYDTVLAMATGRAPDKLQPLSVNATVERFIGFYRDTFKRNDVELVYEPDRLGSEILSDAVRLRHILVNLAQNSVQAMSGMEGRKVFRIQVVTIDNEISITVEDTGVGIPPHIYDNLFTPWATSKPTGTGLGLSTTKQWLNQMGGSISMVTPRGHRGAVFRISIPRFDRAAVTVAPEGVGPVWVV